MTGLFAGEWLSGKRAERGDGMETGMKGFENNVQKKQPLVSVIMPVYNTEKYIGQAIESVLSQTCPDFELLIVDDGSKDRSRDICEEYSKKDSRISVFTNDTDMHGPGSARNIGLNHASGEYLYFMDSDDWLDENLLETVVNCMRQTGADIVQFGVIYEYGNSKAFWNGKSILTKAEISENFSEFWNNTIKSLWVFLFQRELIKNIRFENIINGEDVCFVMDAMSRMETISYVSEVFYHYRHMEGSTCHRWNPETFECLAVQWKHSFAFLNSFEKKMNVLAYALAAYECYDWALYQLRSSWCPLSFLEKIKRLSDLRNRIGFESYRGVYPLEMQQGIIKVKYALVKYHMEWLILLFEPLLKKMLRRQ